jgi:hypothetical protein
VRRNQINAKRTDEHARDTEPSTQRITPGQHEKPLDS